MASGGHEPVEDRASERLTAQADSCSGLDSCQLRTVADALLELETTVRAPWEAAHAARRGAFTWWNDRLEEAQELLAGRFLDTRSEQAVDLSERLEANESANRFNPTYWYRRAQIWGVIHVGVPFMRGGINATMDMLQALLDLVEFTIAVHTFDPQPPRSFLAFVRRVATDPRAAVELAGEVVRSLYDYYADKVRACVGSRASVEACSESIGELAPDIIITIATSAIGKVATTGGRLGQVTVTHVDEAAQVVTHVDDVAVTVHHADDVAAAVHHADDLTDTATHVDDVAAHADNVAVRPYPAELLGTSAPINAGNGRQNCLYCALALDESLSGRAGPLSALRSNPYATGVLDSNQSGAARRFVETRVGRKGVYISETPSELDTLEHGLGALEDTLRSRGPGSRAIILGVHRSNPSTGHAWNAINWDGVIYHIDAQMAVELPVEALGLEVYWYVVTTP